MGAIQMRRQRRNLLALLVSLQLVTLCLGQGFWTAAFKGFIDFPCAHDYQEQRRCLERGNPFIELEPKQNLQAFIDIGEVGYSGLGCLAQSSDTSRLELRHGLLQLELKRDGDLLYVNGKAWPEGQVYSSVIFWNTNPWTIYRFKAVNYGMAGFCEETLPPRMVIMGRFEDEISFAKAGLLLAAALSLVVGLSRFRFGPGQA